MRAASTRSSCETGVSTSRAASPVPDYNATAPAQRRTSHATARFDTSAGVDAHRLRRPLARRRSGLNTKTCRTSSKVRHRGHESPRKLSSERDLWPRRRTGASRHTQRPQRRLRTDPPLLLNQPDSPMPPVQIELRTPPQLDRGHIARLVDPAVRILQRKKYLQLPQS